MNLLEAMKQRHSVRQYLDIPLENNIVELLQNEIDLCNMESGLHIQLITNEPKAFDSKLAHYGNFSGVNNYIALVGKKSAFLEECCGYYGERLVLKAQQLGLNTCWVALTYKKIPEVFQIHSDEKLVIVISIGYGKTQGKQHSSKTMEAVSNISSQTPEWFKRGVQAALLAPTAINQQKFKLIYEDGKVNAKPGLGPCAKIDLGIVKYHFEIGAGKEHFSWK